MNDSVLEDLNKCVDNCTNFVHYDIAILVYKVFKKMYRYIGANHWEYFDVLEKEWKTDHRIHRFKNDIKSVIVDLFITRSLYWFDLSKTLAHDIHAEMRAKFMYQKMLKASYTIKNDKFISIVIKEARGFFDIHND